MVVFDKNAGYTPRAEQYRYQLQKAAELSEWSKLWNPRGSQTGAVRRGLGIGVNAWGGAGHACTCPHHHQSRWLRAARNGHARISAPAPAPS